jgi:aromatic ring-cleaving dioxygenase
VLSVNHGRIDGKVRFETKGRQRHISMFPYHELAGPCLLRCGEGISRNGDRAICQEVQVGRFHERVVGPHPRWSFQNAFEPTQFSDVVGWLTLNHGALAVFVHPNTDNELRDHRDCALWLGRSYQLNLTAVGG